jgi:hypothetical protein
LRDAHLEDKGGDGEWGGAKLKINLMKFGYEKGKVDLNWLKDHVQWRA